MPKNNVAAGSSLRKEEKAKTKEQKHPEKHNIDYLFRKAKVKPYLLKAFLLFTKWEEKTQITRDEFKKKLKEFLKR